MSSAAQRSPAHERISKLACHLWEERGAPMGPQEVDRVHIERELAREQTEHIG